MIKISNTRVNVSNITFKHSKNIFQEVRQFIRDREGMDGQNFAVFNCENKLLYVLKYKNNNQYNVGIDFYRNEEKTPIPAYYDYSLDGNVDLTVLDRADIYAFYEFNEYTFALAEIIRKRLKNREILFLDKNAKFFYPDCPVLNKEQFQYYVLKNGKKRILYIYKEFGTPFPWTNTFDCVSLFHSVFWIQLCGNVSIEKAKFLVLDYPKEAVGGLSAQISTYSQLFYYARDKGLELVSKDDNFMLYSIDILNKYFNFNIKKKDSNLCSNKIVITSNLLLDWCLSLKANLSINYDDILKEDFLSYLKNNTIDILPSKKRILGVLVRGTDFVVSEPSGHCIQANVSSVIQQAKKMIEFGSYEYIYLATEDEDIFYEFLDCFGENLLYVLQKRYSRKTLMKEHKKVLAELVSKNEMERQLVDYMTVLYVLSQCTSLLASGWCGGVRTALGLNEGRFEDIYIFELGYY